MSLVDTQGNSVQIKGAQNPAGSEVSINSMGSINLTAAKGITLSGESIDLQSKTSGITLTSTGQKIALKADDIDLTVRNTVNAAKG